MTTMDRERFDGIFQQLTFGVKRTANASQSNTQPEKLPLRLLPEVPKKRAKKSNKENSANNEGIRLFTDSIVPISSSTKKKKPVVEESHEDKVAKLRQLNNIFTWGSDLPDPFIEFNDLDLPKRLLKNIRKAEFNEPTPIQMQAVPIMIKRRNLLANAPTGSGKTLAFILPILKLLLKKSKGDKPVHLDTVVLCPTNVLAQQIYVQFLKFAHKLPIEVGLLEPDVSIDNINILVATPHKFIYSLKKESLTPDHLAGLRWLVLDEADRLFETTEGDRNFRLQFDEIHKACKGTKTRFAFFSATFSYELEHWCKESLDDVPMLCIGARNSANSAVKQELVYTGDESGKILALEQLFNTGFQPPALIFLQSKERCGSVFVELQARCPKIPMRLMSSELTNEARETILEKFRSGDIWVVISTEMLARGLDIPNVNLVVNFDLPNSIISYIHRVGRTGRAGRIGRSITFYTYGDLRVLRPIATVIHQSGFPVPDFILNLEKPTRDQRNWLLKHAPNREDVGSLGRWKRLKKGAVKDRIIKPDYDAPKKKKFKKRKTKNQIKEGDSADAKKPDKATKTSVNREQSTEPDGTKKRSKAADPKNRANGDQSTAALEGTKPSKKVPTKKKKKVLLSVE